MNTLKLFIDKLHNQYNEIDDRSNSLFNILKLEK